MKAKMTLEEIAKNVQGELIGNPQKEILRLCPLDEPDISAVAYTTKKSARGLLSATFGALIVPIDFQPDSDGNFIKVKNPYEALVSLIPLFTTPALPEPGISPKADIHPTASIGEHVYIGPFAVISAHTSIGKNTYIFPQVVIYPHVTIGAHCIIHAGAIIREGVTIGNHSVIQNGAVIGSDGFGYVPDPDLGLKPIPQIGNVILKERVDVGANSCIDRATLGSTSIGLGTKIDNLVQVGHNVKIGQHAVLCGQVGVAGSVTIGNQAVLGGNVGVADHITIGDKARFAAKSGVIEDTPDAGDYGGHPAIPIKMHMKNQVVGKRLAETLKELKEK